MMSHSPAPKISDKSCWRSIGVHGGDRSCVRLHAVVHCRNCPVYCDGARDFLRRNISANERITALPPTPLETLRSALLMDIDGIQIGIAVTRIVEIAPAAPLRRIPHRVGRAVAGLTNVRGQLHLTLALAQVFGIEKSQLVLPSQNIQTKAHGAAKSAPLAAQIARPRTVLLSGIGGAPIALRADHVFGVHGFASDALAPIPQTLPARLAACVNAVGQFAGARYLLLDDAQFAQALFESINT